VADITKPPPGSTEAATDDGRQIGIAPQALAQVLVVLVTLVITALFVLALVRPDRAATPPAAKHRPSSKAASSAPTIAD